MYQLPKYTEPKRSKEKQLVTGTVSNGWSVDGMKKVQ